MSPAAEAVAPDRFVREAQAVSAIIEYFYSAHSAFAYLGSMRMMTIARAAGRRIVHRPMDLRQVVRESGAQPFGQRSDAHIRYFFGREIERWSEERDAPMMGRMPTHHRNDITLPNCLIIAGIRAGLDVDLLAHALLEGHWRDDADLADPDTLVLLARQAGYDPGPLLEAADDPEVRAAYAANTREAVARSVFGSPTWFVDGDMFYGQDRLEMIERALKRPYRASDHDIRA
jgi:2-hydroxychromene-2-carboxylate isomerase